MDKPAEPIQAGLTEAIDVGGVNSTLFHIVCGPFRPLQL